MNQDIHEFLEPGSIPLLDQAEFEIVLQRRRYGRTTYKGYVGSFEEMQNLDAALSAVLMRYGLNAEVFYRGNYGRGGYEAESLHMRHLIIVRTSAIGKYVEMVVSDAAPRGGLVRGRRVRDVESIKKWPLTGGIWVQRRRLDNSILGSQTYTDLDALARKLQPTAPVAASAACN